MRKKLLIILSLLLTFLTTYAYSALSTSLAITSEVKFRPLADIRIEGVSTGSSSGASILYESEYSRNTITNGFNLSGSSSTMSYSVTITNSGDYDYCLYDILTTSTNNPNVTYTVQNYNMKDIIEAKTSKTITITYTGATGNVNIINTFDFRKVFKIKYNSQGGSSVSEQVKYENVPVNITSTVPTKDNYLFKSWNVKSDGTGKNYSPNEEYTVDESITLYALWYTNVTIPTNSLCKAKADSTYTGSEINLIKTDSQTPTGYTFNGNNQTNAKEYTITATLKDGYSWSDGSRTNKTFKCTLYKAKPEITLSSSSGTVVMNKTINVSATVKSGTSISTTGTLSAISSSETVATINPTSETITASKTGTSNTLTINGVSNGTSNITFSFIPDDTTNFENAEQVIYAATITKKAEIPTNSLCKAKANATYTGSKITLVTSTTNDGYTLSGYEQTNANESGYTIKATLKSGYRWSDNATGTKTFKCPLYKANAVCTISSTPTLKYPGSSTGNIAYSCTGTGDGAITVASGTTSVITVGSYTNTSIPLTAKSLGTSKITISKAAGTNWNATSKAVDVTVTGTGYTLIANSNGGSFNTSTGWTVDGGNATKSITYGSTYGTLPTVSKTGYTFDSWKTSLTDGNTVTSSTVAQGDATIYAIYNINNPATPTISGGATKIYGASATTLTCATSTTYASGTNKYYSFGYATSDGGTPSNWTEASTTNTLSIAANAYVGQRWYSCRVYASDGTSTSSTITSATTQDTEMTINNAKITFDANGGTISGTSPLYTKKGDTKVYTGIRNTTTGTIPTVSKEGYTFKGWYDSNDNKILNANGSFTGTAVSGYTTASAWALTTDVTLYAKIEDDTKPTVSEIEGGTTLKATSQSLTLKCSDTVGVTAYYFGTTAPSSASDITTDTEEDLTALGSSTGLSKTEVINGTYYFSCRDAAGNYETKSITIRKYQVRTVLEKIAGVRDTYTSANYKTNGGAKTYYVKDGTSLNLTCIYTRPTGSTASTFKGYTTSAPSTSPLSPSTTTPTVATNDTTIYYMWFNRTTYSVTVTVPIDGSVKAETVTQTGNSVTVESGASANGILTVKYGDTVKATATPSSKYLFDNWTGGYVSETTNPVTGAAVKLIRQ